MSREIASSNHVLQVWITKRSDVENAIETTNKASCSMFLSKEYSKKDIGSFQICASYGDEDGHLMNFAKTPTLKTYKSIVTNYRLADAMYGPIPKISGLPDNKHHMKMKKLLECALVQTKRCCDWHINKHEKEIASLIAASRVVSYPAPEPIQEEEKKTSCEMFVSDVDSWEDIA
jgi:hypothetical protein